jgi:trk system potassium uptake protein TrkA
MKSIAVIGLGQFGYQIAISLSQKGFEVVGLDENPDMVDEIKDLISEAIVLDTTDEKAMRSVNIDNVDLAVVAIGSNVQSSLLTTALLQRMNVQEIYVRVINPLQESILRSMGIKNIISIEKEMGIQVSNLLSSSGVGMYVAITDRHSLMEIKVPPKLYGKTLHELNIPSQFRINVVGVKSREATINDDGEVTYSIQMTDVPDPYYTLGKDDLLVVAGTDDYIKKFMRLGREDD